MSCAKTAELIVMLFGMWNRVGPRKHVLGGDAHWHNLANMTELSVCGGDAALHQLTLGTCIIFCKHGTWFVMYLCVGVIQNFLTFNLLWQIVLFSLSEWSSNIFRLMCFEVSLSVLVLSIKIVNEFTRLV